ncbi:MAG: YeeE/YedE family protein [Pseudomonadota bacterium]|nr:YeeE/YedE family protein [Pseudomonadota bacterium]
MTEFTPWTGLAGGLLIGTSAVILLALNGRVAGISGILAGLLPPRRDQQRTWRWMFLVGLILGAGLYQLVQGNIPAFRTDFPLSYLIAGGLLVGLGTRLSGGCTSGHGVCGLGRLSGRSLVATLSFMASGMITVYLTRHWFGA